MNLYEQMLFAAAAQWIRAHKTAQDRINQVRPYLVELRNAIDEVLSDTEPASAPPVTPTQ